MISVPNKIKEQIKKYSAKKNARITFPYDEIDDITNEKLVSESLSFTESICSQNNLKFGLCEASQVSFETFKVGNIKGKTIDVFIEVDCNGYDGTILDVQPTEAFAFNYKPPENVNSVEVTVTGNKVMMLALTKVDGVSTETGILLNPGKNVVYFQKNSYYEISKIIGFEPYSQGYAMPTQIKIKANDENIVTVNGKSLYQIKLGRFIVDSCKRDSTNSEKRKVEAYSYIASNDWQFANDLNKYKTQFAINTNSDLVQNIYCVLFSEFPELIDISGLNTKTPLFEQTTGYGTTTYLVDDFFSDTSHPNNRKGIEVRCATTTATMRNYDGNPSTDNASRRLVGYNNSEYTEKLVDKYSNLVTDYILNQVVASGGYTTNYSRETIYENIHNVVSSAWNTNVIKFYSSSFDTSQTHIYDYYKLNANGRQALYPFWGYGDISDHIVATIVNGIEISYWETSDGTTWSRVERECLHLGDIVEYQMKHPNHNITIERSLTDTTLNYYTAKQSFDEVVHLKDLLEAYFELYAGFGKVSRDGKYENWQFTEDSSLYPKTSLYPALTLYPTINNSLTDINKSQYSTCWFDDEYSKGFSRVYCNYYTSADAPNDKIFKERWLVNKDSVLTGYIEYDLSSNYILTNFPNSNADINSILTRFVTQLKLAKYLPFEVDLIGHPELEAGDMIKVNVNDTNIVNFIMRRTLSGIHALKDTYTNE